MEFKGTFQVTKDDNIRYNLFLVRRKIISMCVMIVILLIGMLFLAAYRMYDKTVPLWMLGIIVLIALAAAAVYAAYSYFIRVKLRVNNAYKNGQLKDFEQEVTVDRSGVKIATEQYSKDVAYKYIWFVHETKKTFYLFVSEKMAIFLSKEQIKDKKDIDMLREIFKKYMHPKKILLRND